MDADNIARKLVDLVSGFAAMWGIIVQAGTDTDTLPFFKGECSGMESPETLVFIGNSASVIPRFIGSVELTTRNRINRIDGKQPGTKALTARAITCLVH